MGYLDCYGTPEMIGKIGTDIQDNKCSWLVVQALARASPDQRKVLETHYGKDNPGDIAKIKALYNELQLEKLYLEFEEKTYASLQLKISQITRVPPTVFTTLLSKIYKRSK